jgi:hypothetical protein
MDLLAPLKAQRQGLLENRWGAEQTLESISRQKEDLDRREADAMISLERQSGAIRAIEEIINIGEQISQQEAETDARAQRDLSDVDLTGHTLADLSDLAAERGVALTGKRTKSQIIEAIREADLDEAAE